MIFRVTHSELNRFTDVMKRDSEDFAKEIKNMKVELERLKETWDGYDAREFDEHFADFLNRLEKLPEGITTIEKVVRATNKKYQDRDIAFSKEIERVAMRNE